MRRDELLLGTLATASLFAVPRQAAAAHDAPANLRALESAGGGRLGVFALDTASGRRISHRSNERFPMCSTFKFLAVAAVFARVDAGRERLERRVSYGERDLLPYAPIARAQAARGSLTIRELCEAALVYSDNTAANLLLAVLGGPAGVTRYARSLGDPLTNLTRTEPSLNSAVPGETRDTTTPLGMAADMRRILTGDALSEPLRRLLVTWLIACRTGRERLRAGLPAKWRAGDKTGSGANGTSNDIAIVWPPQRAPIIVTAYLTGSRRSADARDATLASVGRIVAAYFA
jgi:beta-lactamase class A